MGFLDRKKKEKEELQKDEKQLRELYEKQLKVELSDDELSQVSGGMTNKQAI